MSAAGERETAPAWLLVTRREVLVRLTDRSFLVGTAVTVALIAAFLGFQAWGAERTETYTLAASPDSAAMAEAVRGNARDVEDKVAVRVEQVRDDQAAERLVAEGEVDAWLHPVDDGWQLTTDSERMDDLAAVVSEVVRSEVVADNARIAGVTLEQLEAGSEVDEAFLKGDAERAALAEIVGFAFVFLFYLAALLFGMQLANSVIEEKQSRIVEIIAAAIPLRQLLVGKIAGNTVLALLQVVVYVAVGLVGMSFTPYAAFVPDISGPVLWFIAFFVAGFVALATLWAVAGSLASRTEDLQSTTTPLTMLIMAMLFGGLLLDGKLQVAASFVPPVSAVVMPKRILAGGVPLWEPLLALGLLALFAAAAVVVGERLYRRALLKTGGKVSLADAWASAE